MTLLVDVGRVAAEFGISERQVQRFAARGMPRGQHGEYDLVECHRWRVASLKAQLAAARARASGLDFQRARATRAQADLLERNLQERRTSLVPTHVAEEHATAMFDRVRQTVLAGLPALAVRLAGRSRHEIRQILHSRSCNVLQKLSTGEGMPPVRGAGVQRQLTRGKRTEQPRSVPTTRRMIP